MILRSSFVFSFRHAAPQNAPRLRGVFAQPNFRRHAEAVEILSERLAAAPWDADALLSQAQSRLEASSNRSDALASLTALASSEEATYRIRTDAAQSLRGSDTTPTNLGSEEINVLAGRAGTVAPEAAPFLYRLHIAAAEAVADSAEKASLLKQAIAARPSEYSNHGKLLQAARDAEDHRLAVIVFDPLLSGTNMAGFLRPRSFQSDGQEVPRIDNWMSRQFLIGTNWTTDERAVAALDFADSLEHLGRLRVAGRAYQIGLALDTSAERRTQAEQSLVSINERIRLQVQNAQRRPFIHKNLDQESVVRPRLRSVSEVTTP